MWIPSTVASVAIPLPLAYYANGANPSFNSEDGTPTPSTSGEPQDAPWKDLEITRRKKSWAPHEDAMLLDLVCKRGPSNWAAIAKHIPGRLGKQCRERWHNHLSPEVKKEDFSPEEDQRIVAAVAALGTKWCQMVTLIPGRSDNTIKNRWNSMIRRLSRSLKREGVCRVTGLSSEDDLPNMDPSVLARLLLTSGSEQITPARQRAPARQTPALPSPGKRALSPDDDSDAPASKRGAWGGAGAPEARIRVPGDAATADAAHAGGSRPATPPAPQLAQAAPALAQLSYLSAGCARAGKPDEGGAASLRDLEAAICLSALVGRSTPKAQRSPASREGIARFVQASA